MVHRLERRVLRIGVVRLPNLWRRYDAHVWRLVVMIGGEVPRREIVYKRSGSCEVGKASKTHQHSFILFNARLPFFYSASRLFLHSHSHLYILILPFSKTIQSTKHKPPRCSSPPSSSSSPAPARLPFSPARPTRSPSTARSVVSRPRLSSIPETQSARSQLRVIRL
jgi:hypothetical protein